MTRLMFFVVVFAAIHTEVYAEQIVPLVTTARLPDGGIQPRLAVGQDGAIHLVVFRGEPAAGDLVYLRSNDAGKSFSHPQRINSQPGSAVAVGTIRGAQLTLGRNDRVHVAWNGSATAEPKGPPNPQLPADSPYRLSAPMLYSRMNDRRTEFEPQRNVMKSTYSLDGGGAVAADDQGHVYVIWHANSVGATAGEAGRAVWVAVSRDDGSSFAAEARANSDPTGACGCCGLQAATDHDGNLVVLYRSAQNGTHRDMYELVSADQGQSYTSQKLDPWEVGQCVMSSSALYPVADRLWAAWETEGQVKLALLSSTTATVPRLIRQPPASEHSRKHPVVSINRDGQILLAWTEDTGWQKGGSVAWQIFDASGFSLQGGSGRADGVPVWGSVAAFAREDGNFVILY